MNKKYNRRKKFYRKSNRRKSNKRKNRKKTNRKRNLRGGMLTVSDTAYKAGDPYTERIKRCSRSSAPTIQELGDIASEHPSIESSIIEEIRGIVIQELDTMRLRPGRTTVGAAGATVVAPQLAGTPPVHQFSAFTRIGEPQPQPEPPEPEPEEPPELELEPMSPGTLSSDIRQGPAKSGWSQITFITRFFPDWDAAPVLKAAGTSPLLVLSTVVHDHEMRSDFTSDINTILSNVEGLVIDVEDAEAEKKSKAKEYLIKGLKDLDIYFDSIPDSYIIDWMGGYRPPHFKQYAETLNINATGIPK